MFQVYVKNIPEGLSSYIKIFVDDAKIARQLVNIENCKQLQSDLTNYMSGAYLENGV